MFYRNKKTRKYQAPVAFETHVALESNFCFTVLLDVEVEELKNMNDPNSPDFNPDEGFYFES